MSLAFPSRPNPQSRHHFSPLALQSYQPATTTPTPTLTPLQDLHGIIFDMDGTLCEPQNHMFAAMRAAVPIPPGADILTHIHSLPPSAQEKAHAQIQAIERQAMVEQVPQPGLKDLLEYLDARGVRKAICTRNFDAPVQHLLANHVPGHVRAFEPVVTREFRPPKPAPEGVWHIARSWGVPVEEGELGSEDEATGRGRRRVLLPVVMVGDSVDDVVAGYEAGALTVLLRSPGKEELERDERTDVVIGRLDELVPLLEAGLRSRWL